MANEFLVAPSLLSADFANLASEVKAVEAAGADWLHVDVMDGHFVPNLTIGMPVLKSLKKVATKPLDVHLMIERPERYIEEFAAAGANHLTIHIESTEQPEKVLDQIRGFGVLPGITLRPATPVESVLPYLSQVDLVLVMTVNPGFGGQSFMEDQLEKIRRLRNEIQKLGRKIYIEVDGGINEQTAAMCSDADVLVAGNYIFGSDYKTAIQKLKSAKR